MKGICCHICLFTGLLCLSLGKRCELYCGIQTYGYAFNYVGGNYSLQRTFIFGENFRFNPYYWWTCSDKFFINFNYVKIYYDNHYTDWQILSLCDKILILYQSGKIPNLLIFAIFAYRFFTNRQTRSDFPSSYHI